MYASGMVDGQREWMGLYPYLHPRPRNEAELDERVPIGTSIPIYLFPELKGRSRVRVYADTPPAEAYHREAITAANYGLTGLAICGALLFILNRVRRLCFIPRAVLIPQTGSMPFGADDPRVLPYSPASEKS